MILAADYGIHNQEGYLGESHVQMSPEGEQREKLVKT